MSIRKQDRSMARRHLLMTALLGIPFIACFVIGFNYEAFFWPAFFIGGVIAVMGLTLQTLRFRRYRCQECGTILPYNKPSGSKIEYCCQRCDIIWETGFSESKD